MADEVGDQAILEGMAVRFGSRSLVVRRWPPEAPNAFQPLLHPLGVQGLPEGLLVTLDGRIAGYTVFFFSMLTFNIGTTRSSSGYMITLTDMEAFDMESRRHRSEQDEG